MTMNATKRKYFVLTPLFLGCMCNRNKDSTKNLILNGTQLFIRIRRRIVDDDISIICEFLKENPKVKFVYLQYNNITSNGVTEIARFLQGNESIQLLNLMNNNIDARGVLSLAKLGNDLNLVTLKLNGNPIGERGGRNLALMLLKNNKLRSLDVAQSDLTIESLAYFTTVLKYNNETLEYLNISRVLGQWYYQLLTDHVAQLVGQMLKFNKSLKEIHLEKLCLTDHDIELLVIGLMDNKTLDVLNLACNQIGDFGLECLSGYLGTCPPLKKLQLHHNHIGDTGARAFSFKYPSSRIEFLDISYNRLTEEGVLDILNSIKKPYPIKYLFIRGNKFGTKTYRVIYRMLMSGVLHEDKVDVRIYKEREKVDGKFVLNFRCAYNAYNDHTNAEYYYKCVDKKEMRRLHDCPE